MSRRINTGLLALPLTLAVPASPQAVAACVAAPFSFGSSGAVPVVLIQCSVWCGVMIVVGVSSLATLIQYGWGGSDAAE